MSAKSEEERIKATIYAAFEAGKNRNFGVLSRIHLNDERFSKFGENPPYEIQGVRDALALEEIAFASLSGYDYEVQNLKIILIDKVAIATFVLNYSGILVDNTTFEGRAIKVRSRVTFVLIKSASDWLIIHEHLSQIPNKYG
ncbi:MAG: nuclear transport factor 2 family protein [Thaumarchaeota archaeon]|nr:nuclear transport factor 2 family protein [Nitrososphaerota archaeon]